jgi:hypothetical protein
VAVKQPFFASGLVAIDRRHFSSSLAVGAGLAPEVARFGCAVAGAGGFSAAAASQGRKPAAAVARNVTLRYLEGQRRVKPRNIIVSSNRYCV